MGAWSVRDYVFRVWVSRSRVLGSSSLLFRLPLSKNIEVELKPEAAKDAHPSTGRHVFMANPGLPSFLACGSGAPFQSTDFKGGLHE